MATNLVQDGNVLTVTAPATTASGDMVKVGQLFGVAVHDAASGADVAIATDGVYTLPKTSAQAWAVGDPIYWSTGSSVCTTVATSNHFIGVAAAVAANPSSTGQVRLNGSMPKAAG